MPIALPNPVTVPAVPASPEKTFSEAWVRSISIQATTGGPEDSIYIQLCPFNASTGERLAEPTTEIKVPLWEAIDPDNCLEAAQAFGAIIAAIPALLAKYV